MKFSIADFRAGLEQVGATRMEARVAARLLAATFFYTHEAFVFGVRLNTAVRRAQVRGNVLGGECPDPEVAARVRRVCGAARRSARAERALLDWLSAEYDADVSIAALHKCNRPTPKRSKKNEN